MAPPGSPSRNMTSVWFLFLAPLCVGVTLAQSTRHVPRGTQLHAAGAQAPRILFVDVDAGGGANDGSSWLHALPRLQDALAQAVTGDEIWVAEGTYWPTTPNGQPEATFRVRPGVSVYGGFAGTEAARDQRDPLVHVTVLSGDLGSDDTATVVTLPNAFHVVTMDGSGVPARLDGVTVTGGYSFFAPVDQRRGGGLLLTNPGSVVAGCRFFRNRAEGGGGAHVLATARLEGCSFEENRASAFIGEGGALLIGGTSDVHVTDCFLSFNAAEAVGGWSLGGAIRSGADTVLTVERCTFEWNAATPRSSSATDWCRGGAAYCEGDSRIVHCCFMGNASNIGGAVQSWALAPDRTRIWNSVFHNNDAVAVTIGGIVQDGTAAGIAGGNEVDLIGVVVHGGVADNYGGVSVGNGKISGCVFWNNTDGSGQIGTSNVRAGGNVEYSCVQNMLVGQPGEDPPNPARFPGSIATNPAFVNAPAGDFRLLPGSPCIDAGDSGAVPEGVTTDLDGAPRRVDDPATPAPTRASARRRSSTWAPTRCSPNSPSRSEPGRVPSPELPQLIWR